MCSPGNETLQCLVSGEQATTKDHNIKKSHFSISWQKWKGGRKQSHRENEEIE